MSLPRVERIDTSIKGTFKPKRSAVKIRQFKQREITDGGIIIPEAFRKKQNWGEVLEVGDEVKSVKVGETVMFMPGNYPVYEENGIEVTIVPEYAILLGK